MELLPEKDLTRWVYIRPTDPAVNIPTYSFPPPKIIEVLSFSKKEGFPEYLFVELGPDNGILEFRGVIQVSKPWVLYVSQGYDGDNIVDVGTYNGVANGPLVFDVARHARYIKFEIQLLEYKEPVSGIVSIIGTRW